MSCLVCFEFQYIEWSGEARKFDLQTICMLSAVNLKLISAKLSGMHFNIFPVHTLAPYLEHMDVLNSD